MICEAERMKKPQLIAGALEPPRQLGRAGRDTWDRVQAEFHVADAGSVEMLTLTCEAVDRAETLAAEIARDGPVIRDAKGVRSHPALRDELQNRAFAARTLARLKLEIEVRPIGRPGGTSYGWRG
jgi:hypothetical protein